MGALKGVGGSVGGFQGGIFVFLPRGVKMERVGRCKKVAGPSGVIFADTGRPGIAGFTAGALAVSVPPASLGWSSRLGFGSIESLEYMSLCNFIILSFFFPSK